MLRKILACSFFLSLPAGATSFSTDISDLWFNEAESGWGVNIIQQGNILFATLFVYGQNGQPTWYVGPDLRHNGSGQLVFSGPFYQTTGPFHGGAFNPNAVTVRQVGNATFTLTSITNGTFQYTADGAFVTKQVVRQTWVNNNLTGSFIGGANGTYTNCPGFNGYIEESAAVAITHNGTAIAITAQGAAATCTYNGQYSQRGRMGAATGSFSCTNGFTGQFSAAELEASISHVAGRVILQSGACGYSGRIGGLRRGPQ